jgi:anti-sigma regulatory factor (Ser/Thr protein kinase)
MDDVLDISPRAPREARSFVAACLPPETCSEAVADLLLLTSEVVTNAVRHGDPRADAQIALCVDVSPREIKISVRGPGLGPEPNTTARRPEGIAGSGWGLYLLRRMTTDWGVEGDGTVWFSAPRAVAWVMER